MQVHLIDGTFELFRAFYGAPPARTSDGREVGAVRGLAQSFAALLRDPSVTHVACAFDHVIESFRNDLFPGYKTGAGIDPDLLAQFELAEDATRALGIVVWPMLEFEADDALASGAARFAAERDVSRVVLCSPDKDLCQCVSGDRIVCWDRMRSKILDAAAVVQKFGIAPSSIPDYLALVGDSADGIPGVPRWGQKSAALVLARYGSIENIPDRVEDWEVAVRGSAALADSLRSMRAEARLYKQLATLRTDVPLGESLEDLCFRGPDRARLRALAAVLEDDRIAQLSFTKRG